MKIKIVTYSRTAEKSCTHVITRAGIKLTLPRIVANGMRVSYTTLADNATITGNGRHINGQTELSLAKHSRGTLVYAGVGIGWVSAA